MAGSSDGLDGGVPQAEPDGSPGEELDGGSAPATECQLAFLEPVSADAGGLSLDGTSDADGEPCGVSFQLPVTLSSNASSVTLFVNDAPLSSQDVLDGTVDFDAVLGNRGSTPNALRARAVMADGSVCSLAFDSPIFVDCAGPSCSIAAPLGNAAGFLNASQDGDEAGGLQTDVLVSTEAAQEGQPVRLQIDGSFGAVEDGTVLAADGQGSATFSAVTLAEGPRTLRAECRDEAGGTTLSGPARFTVDLTPCVISLDSLANGADPITSQDDLSVQADTQVLAAGHASGGDCQTLRIGVCGGAITQLPLALANDGSFAVPVTLTGTTGSVDVCASVVDRAGNFSAEDRISANLRLGPPQVAIVSPGEGTRYNRLGTAGALPDGDGFSSSCEVTVVAQCSDVGDPVALLVEGVQADTQSCGAGHQVALNASLVSKNDGSSTALTVRQTADGFASPDAALDVQADCEPPVLGFAGLTCGSLLALAGDDADGDAPGLQFDVTALNGGEPTVTLTVTGSAADTEIVATGDETTTAFPALDLGGVGDVFLTACATDAQGNVGCSESCSLTIVAEPTIAVTSPAAGSVLSTLTPDCDVNASGLQITVQGTTSASDGSAVQVALGLQAPVSVTAAGGTFTACIDAPEGRDQSLVASVTDDVTALSGLSSLAVSVDTVPPSGTIAAPSATLLDRRRGTAQLTWSSILDSDGDRLTAYRLRCANSDITSEAAWSAATELPVALSPASSAGAVQTEDVVGLVKAGMSSFCVLRGEDDGGQLSPITNGLSLATSNPFRTQQYAVTDDAGGANLVNVVVEPLGDINGDGIADFAYGTANLGVDVFLGNTDLDASPSDIKSADFTIRNTTAVGSTLGFGSEVAGLGDINGDSRPDFAVSARGANTVFVFFGRAPSSPWSNITLSSMSPCQADLCIIGAGVGAGSGLFGWDIGSANFDGAGPQDLVISGRSIQSVQANAGRVFVLLGGPQLATSGTTITLPASNPDGFIIDPPTGRTAFGVSFAGVTGTGGVDDLIIGSNGSLATATAATANRVTGRSFPGPSGLITINANAEFENGPVGNYGNPVRALGDFNGDGRGDLAVGRNVNQGGIVNLYLGLASGGFNNQAGNLLTFANELFPAFDDNHGQFTAQGFVPGLGTLGDLDLDGKTELFTGSTTPDVGGARGSSNLFYGSASPAISRTRASADFAYTPINTQVVPNFVGDINNDTFPDVAVLDSGTGANVLFLMY